MAEKTTTEIEEKLENTSITQQQTEVVATVGNEDVIVARQADSSENIPECLATEAEFQNFNFDANLMKGIFVGMKWERPTTIQEIALPYLLAKPPVNFVGQAKPGTGKTGAFVLCMAHRVDPNLREPQAICLAPTRELARQIYQVVEKLIQFTNLKIRIIVPKDKGESSDLLSYITEHIIIGTPGSLEGLVKRQNILNCKNVRVLVVDEADIMLTAHNQGLSQPTQLIKKRLPPNVQTLLFSATFPETVKRFVDAFVPHPRVMMTLKPQQLIHSTKKLTQYYIVCETIADKNKSLELLLTLPSIASCLIFVHTQVTADALYSNLTKQNHSVGRIHGKILGSERDRTMKEFQNGTTRIMVATNALARGIDELSITLVLNYDMPVDFQKRIDLDTYLHRIGRTARMKFEGIAVSLVGKQELHFIKEIEEHFGEPVHLLDLKDLQSFDYRLKTLQEQRNK
eukprot:TRINITY_DN101_c0_g1_i1.p1 TRINITY_DN101_c0_g1~~TRINITY_DN101_c0_g1_i1.p1  ORF type:complete len:471 (-),score=75.67 TRINITY_DN101_c0_g1_i1:25-1395(-)